MMDSVLNCGTGGWFMTIAGIVTYGLLGLASAALIKYLFFTTHGSTPNPRIAETGDAG